MQHRILHAHPDPAGSCRALLDPALAGDLPDASQRAGDARQRLAQPHVPGVEVHPLAP